jgi:hypothetical protein
MNILVAGFAYNERPYIADMVKYYRKQGCSLFIIDNFSTDGTYEWLKANNVPTVRVDTNDSFLLTKLNEELTKNVHAIHPDWVVYVGIDIRYFFNGTIKEEIEKAEKQKCNVIEVNHFTACNTGEELILPLHKHFFHMKEGNTLKMIAKFDPKYFEFIPDGIKIKNEKVHKSNGVLINYGNCKPKKERNETYQRRKKAWDLGEHRGHGIHYKPGSEKNWLWSKEELIDIRTTSFIDLIL